MSMDFSPGFFTEKIRSIAKNRLSLLERMVYPKRQREKAKPRRKLRKGLLKTFVDLPLEIICEIASYLELADLLKLARLSKTFRAFFMSRYAASNVWTRVLQGIEGLPPCPQDLSEPQYASLLVDKFCMACGSARSNYINLNLRLRLCGRCYYSDIRPGFFFRSYVEIEPELLSLVPSSQDIRESDEKRYDHQSLFFVPEVEAMFSALSNYRNARNDDIDSYYACIAELKSKATKMMKEGSAIREWQFILSEHAERDFYDLLDRRIDMIIEEMKSIGWTEEDFPNEIFDDPETVFEWETYMNQPKGLTARGLKKLTPILNDICLSVQKERRIQTLEIDLFGYYHKIYVLNQDDWHKMPAWKHIYESDIYQDFAALNHNIHINVAIPNDTLNKLFDDLVQENENRLKNMELTVAKELRKFYSRQAVQKLDPLTILDFAASLVICEEKGKNAAKPFSGAVRQVTLNLAHPQSLTCRSVEPTVDRDLVETAMDVVEALGLPRTAKRSDVLSLAPSAAFECKCGHYKYSGSLAFEDLAFHVHEERKWRMTMNAFTRKADMAAAMKKKLIVDSHCSSALRDLVGVAEFSLSEYKTLCRFPMTRGDAASAEANVSGKKCRTCQELCGHLAPAVNEPGEYHMLYKHGREMQRNDLFIE